MVRCFGCEVAADGAAMGRGSRGVGLSSLQQMCLHREGSGEQL